jgi:S-formylglutathione hydrolase
VETRHSKVERLSRYRSFGGWVEFYRHLSTETKTEMKFSVYRPPQAESRSVPVVYWLSGLTCTEETFMMKAGAQRAAARLGLMLVAPDTSPRGAGIEGEDASWDFGTGAGFYLNATEPKWATNYRMEAYVTQELRQIIESEFPVIADRQSIMGHSMGGHGALVLALRYPGKYRSVSAFAPISAPTQCPWGEKAFSNYLGADRTKWAAYDTNELVKTATEKLPIRIDQGEDDQFLKVQLLPEKLEQTCRQVGYPLDLRRHPGYDHGYYFIASFIDEHLDYHAGKLNGF